VKFYELQQETLYRINSNDNIVMAGDFKVRVGNTPVKNITEIKEENA
jgi:ATP-dependent protease HslVU (ClpYQ) peptidase subunit